jgi:hypothetical protein
VCLAELQDLATPKTYVIAKMAKSLMIFFDILPQSREKSAGDHRMMSLKRLRTASGKPCKQSIIFPADRNQ